MDHAAMCISKIAMIIATAFQPIPIVQTNIIVQTILSNNVKLEREETHRHFKHYTYIEHKVDRSCQNCKKEQDEHMEILGKAE